MKKNILLSILNIIIAIWSYQNESYKTAMFSTFAAGFVAASAYALHKLKKQ